MSWWVRPVVRLLAALSLPLVVPAVLTGVLWALPGDPAELICPRSQCPGTEALAQRWGVDQGPVHYYVTWLGNALTGDFGNSWKVQQGFSVAALVRDSVPYTGLLIGLALIPLLLGSVLAALQLVPRRLDPVWYATGMIPAVILALFAAAQVEINYGAMSYSGWPLTLRMLLGAAVLGLADGALANAVSGTRGTFDEEVKQRYVQIAVLRGESEFWNSLPNVLPSLVGQTRGRVLHLMSGAVIVEVVLGVPGLGELLFLGTLTQDFTVVLTAAWGYSVFSALLLVAQAGTEIAHGVWVRRHPRGVIPSDVVPAEAR